MGESSVLIYRVLTRAHVVLKEVEIAMTKSYSISSDEAKGDIIEAHELIGRVLRHKNEILEVSSDIEYDDLVIRLKAKKMPITSEELEDVDMDWDE